MSRPLVIAAVLVSGLLLAACESSQTKSARLEKTGRNQAKQTTITAGAANTGVKVVSTAVLSSPNGNAAVVQVRNTTSAAQVQVPIFIATKTAKPGPPVYKNDVAGLQPALQQMAFLDKGQTAYWVNDQVLSPDPLKSVEVQIGKAKGTPPAAIPEIDVAPPKLEQDSTGAYATGEIKNLSKITQINLPIFGVALKDGKVVAAGRAIIDKLAPAPTKKPVNYKIFFIGNPKGAKLELTAAPTVLQEGKTP